VNNNVDYLRKTSIKWPWW